MVARWQTIEHGMPQHLLHTMLRSGRWVPRHPGVYATFTGPLPRRAELWAAVLHASVGRTVAGRTHEPDAVLSHETAAELHGLIDRPSTLIHVTVPDRRRRPVAPPGVKVHSAERLSRTRHPAQSPPRTRVEDTVLDLTQSCADLDAAVDWLSRACGKRLTTTSRLAAALRERGRVRWRAGLRYALDDTANGAHNLFELLFCRLVERAHGLPAAARQVRRARGGGVEYDDVDYEEFRTLVRLDGRVHEYEERFRDMERDNSAVSGARTRCTTAGATSPGARATWPSRSPAS
jgi:hypothetical protein